MSAEPSGLPRLRRRLARAERRTMAVPVLGPLLWPLMLWGSVVLVAALLLVILLAVLALTGAGEPTAHVAIARGRSVVVVRAAGGNPRTIAVAAGPVSAVAISPDDRLVAFASGHEVRLVPTGGGGVQRLGEAQHVREIVWDPAGRGLLLVDRGGLALVRLVDGATRRVIADGTAALPSFSDDGSRIAYLHGPPGHRDIGIVSTDGGRPTAATTSGRAGSAAFGSNGELAFRDGAGVWLLAASGQRTRRLVAAALDPIAWPRPEVIVASSSGPATWLIDVRTGKARRLVVRARPLAASHDGRSLLLADCVAARLVALTIAGAHAQTVATGTCTGAWSR